MSLNAVKGRKKEEIMPNEVSKARELSAPDIICSNIFFLAVQQTNVQLWTFSAAEAHTDAGFVGHFPSQK